MIMMEEEESVGKCCRHSAKGEFHLLINGLLDASERMRRMKGDMLQDLARWSLINF